MNTPTVSIKRLSIILASMTMITLCLTAGVQIVKAQQEIADFAHQYEKYRQEFPQFETARNEYLKQKTLASGNDAIDKTQALLIQRAQVLRTYYFALRYKLNTTTGVGTDDKATLGGELNDRLGWLQNHLDDLQGIKNPTLTDLFEISDRLERQESEYRLLSYKVLSKILTAKVLALNQELIAVNADLNPYVTKTGSGYTRNWLNESVNVSYEVANSIKKMEAKFETLSQQNGSPEMIFRSYTEIQQEGEQAQRSILKGVGFQKEIIGDLEKTLPKEVISTIENKPSTSSAETK